MMMSVIARSPSVESTAASMRSSPGMRRDLELLGVGQRHLGHADPLDRRVEIVEADLLDPRRELGGDAVARPALLDADGAAGLGDRGGDGLDVERAQRAQVDDLGADAVLALARRSATCSARTVA